MTDAKIQGKFYPLQHEEWLRACRELTPAQRDVLYYLRTLDPYSTGMEVSPARIAKDLSTPEKPVHRSTVGRALKALDEKGFVDMELLKVKVHVLTKGLHCCDETTSCDEATSCSETTSCDEATLLPDGNLGDRDATCAIATQLARSPRNKRQPKAAPAKDSSTPKINKTYLDFIDSLSEGEKESFLKFGNKKAAELKNPPVQLPLKWIEKNFEELSEQWFPTRDENENQNQKYNFGAYSQAQHQMWYGQLQTLVCGAAQSGDSARLEQFLKDDFYCSWLNWAKTAREDVREFLASNPIPIENLVKAQASK
ncbi:MAG: MarR family transcriptional regulator [Nostoc sp. DedQUE04]|uniref:MarR family transcriptional regulator n=1 Tax=Nostoc sp. DedQUE04 TaxID=3075390 RepID=UPI002AD56748|nr:MarR family transcriptional regulator [Nostoc sp. DedQUE04]MDZ8139005.1 MarR family transcriptional regulator [Nostoc sp. DedQUE04]